MKIFYMALVILLTSCGSAQFHINRAEKHTQKAIDKGAVVSIDSDTTLSVDTTIFVDTFSVNDTVYISTVKTVEKIVKESGEIRYVTRKDKRKEHRLDKREQRYDYKIKKKEVRQSGRNQRVRARNERKSKKSYGRFSIVWRNLLIIALLLVIIYLWIRKK